MLRDTTKIWTKVSGMQKALMESLAKIQEERNFARMKEKKSMTRDSFVCLALGQCLAAVGVN